MTRGRRTGTGIRKQEGSRLSAAHVVLSRTAPDVTTRWLGDPAYRDRDGQPRRLRLKGAGPSLSKLILRVVPTGDVDEIATFLVRSGTVCKSGEYYTLESRFVPFSADLGAAFAYTAANIQRYLGTVTHNLSCINPEDTFVERSALNRHIPVRASPKIHRYLRRQMGNLISRVDAYLQRQEVAPDSEPTVELGLNIFAFEQSHNRPGGTASDAASIPRDDQINRPRRSRSRATS